VQWKLIGEENEEHFYQQLLICPIANHSYDPHRYR